MVKTLFIPTKIKSTVNKSKILGISKKLPKDLAIAYSIQYENIAKEIKDILSKNKKITSFIQILGCSKPNFLKTTKAILLIGSGRFHALSLASQTKLPIYILEQNTLYQISKKDLENHEKKSKAAYLKFLHADKIGIITSTKQGQQKLKDALALKNKLKDKTSYLFLADNINSNEFENFKIDSWINTACPRLDMDARVVNVDKVESK